MNEPKETTKICGTCQGFGGYPRCPECLNARTAKSEPSQTTKRIVAQLYARDAKGQDKYGTSMDRRDLTPSEWAQHAIEEMLDGAQYLERVKGALELLERARDIMSQEVDPFGNELQWIADYNRQFGK